MNIENNFKKIKLFDEISNAYLQIKSFTTDTSALCQAFETIFVQYISDFQEPVNHPILSGKYKINSDVFSVLPQQFSNKYCNNGYFTFPIDISNKEAFSLIIKTDDVSRKAAESFLQATLLALAEKAEKGDIYIKCADGKRSGLSYGGLIKLITENEYFGKKIYKSNDDISLMITEAEAIATDNIIKLNGTTNSVYRYNESNPKKIPITVMTFCDIDNLEYGNSTKQLSTILENSNNNGISTIVLTENYDNNIIKILGNSALCFKFENNVVYYVDNTDKTPIVINNEFDFVRLNALEDKLNKIESIDTRFASFYDIDTFNYFSMDSTDKLLVPFGFDENNNIVNLEIGGNAPPHALLSGSTNSGKSVLLHTIIDQITLNYHPNDVEIWAIDYKAVEFGCYALNKTPHISVIGQDNSDDFSLSLLETIQKEYNRRKNLFVENNTKDFEAYRKRFGKHSMSRILIVIDEFHNLTQAIQRFNGEKNYKTILENLLREMRAMGMSFLFCSQTIAAGLEGLTEAARNQIGCRLSMRHEDTSEIRQTLSLSVNSDVNLEEIKNLQRGQVVYRKSASPGALSENTYKYLKLNVIFISDELREQIINNTNRHIRNDYIKRDEIICKNSNRYQISDKTRHPISRYINKSESINFDAPVIFPGAPTTLDDYFSIKLTAEEGNNILIVGSNDELRESLIYHTVISLLADDSNIIVFSSLDTENINNSKLYTELQKIKSKRFVFNLGFEAVTSCIESLSKLRPHINGNIIYIWCGTNKLKNLVFLNSEESPEENCKQNDITESEQPLASVQQALSQILKNTAPEKVKESHSYEHYQSIMKQLFEYGPENNRYNIAVYSTVKSMKKTGLIKLDNYEYRIGLQMSVDDSYDIFGSSSFITKADEKTAVLYNGSKNPQTLRPYLFPNKEFVEKLNERLAIN